MTHTGEKPHQIFFTSIGSYEATPNDSLWGKVPSMCPVQLYLKLKILPSTTPNDSLWGKAPQMFTMWIFKHYNWSFDNPHEDCTYWREAIPLWPVWDIVWLCRSLAETKLCEHLPHLYGFSPVCALLMWIVNWLVEVLEKSHCGHLWGFSPEWVICCCGREYFQFEVKLHWAHCTMQKL